MTTCYFPGRHTTETITLIETGVIDECISCGTYGYSLIDTARHLCHLCVRREASNRAQIDDLLRQLRQEMDTKGCKKLPHSPTVQTLERLGVWPGAAFLRASELGRVAI